MSPRESSRTPSQENLICSVYYAPRGRRRLYLIAHELAERYLYSSDHLVAIIGPAGSGKSTFIRGLFPGLELTNDDRGVNLRNNPLFSFDQNDFFSGHTFHVDVRYASAFHQKHEIAEAISNALHRKRRVVVEHFDEIYNALGINAQIIFGIGEEIIVSRPSVFGPGPQAIRAVVEKSMNFRRMAHSAEDIVSMILLQDYGYERPRLHSDLRRGFVIRFMEKPQISIPELEAKTLDIINADVPITTAAEVDRIHIGKNDIYCTGSRMHVSSTGKIENLRLLPDYIYEPMAEEYLLVGKVGKQQPAGFDIIMDDLEFDP